jgi:hypothetical protein
MTRSWSPPLIHRLHGGSQDENADLVVDEPKSILCQDDDEEELVTRNGIGAERDLERSQLGRKHLESLVVNNIGDLQYLGRLWHDPFPWPLF